MLSLANSPLLNLSPVNSLPLHLILVNNPLLDLSHLALVRIARLRLDLLVERLLVMYGTSLKKIKLNTRDIAFFASMFIITSIVIIIFILIHNQAGSCCRRRSCHFCFWI
jgi:hypothetical protein